jgi:hypothetical protein
MIRVLVACEESQAVTVRLRALGFEAFSCDILPCSGGHPEWHYQQDVFEVIDQGWDAMIAFPPCTHLAVSGAAWFEQKRKDGRQQEGIDFFMRIANAPINHIAIENPVGIMSKIYRKPDQVIRPYYFGDSSTKSTCLWLKNLPLLKHYPQSDMFNNKTWCEVEYHTTASGKVYDKWWFDTCLLPTKNGQRASARSKTFPGIATAMAEQWGAYLKSKFA